MINLDLNVLSLKVLSLKVLSLNVIIAMLSILSACESILVEDQKICQENLSCPLGYACQDGKCVETDQINQAQIFDFKKEVIPPPVFEISNAFGDATDIKLKSCDFDLDFSVPYLPSAELKIFRMFCISKHIFVFASELFQNDYPEYVQLKMQNDAQIDPLSKGFFNSLKPSKETDRPRLEYVLYHADLTNTSDLKQAKFIQLNEILPDLLPIYDRENKNTHMIQDDQMIDIRLLTENNNGQLLSSFLVIYSTKNADLTASYLSQNKYLFLKQLNYVASGIDASIANEMSYKMKDLRPNDNLFFNHYVIAKNSIYFWRFDKQLEEKNRELVRFSIEKIIGDQNQSEIEVTEKVICLIPLDDGYQPLGLSLMLNPQSQLPLIFYPSFQINQSSQGLINIIDLNDSNNVASCQNQYELSNQDQFNNKLIEMKQNFKDFDIVKSQSTLFTTLKHDAGNQVTNFSNSFGNMTPSEKSLFYHSFKIDPPFKNFKYQAIKINLDLMEMNEEIRFDDQKIWAYGQNLFLAQKEGFSEKLQQCNLSLFKIGDEDEFYGDISNCIDRELNDSYEIESQLLDIQYYEKIGKNLNLLLTSQTYSTFSDSENPSQNENPVLVWNFETIEILGLGM